MPTITRALLSLLLLAPGVPLFAQTIPVTARIPVRTLDSIGAHESFRGRKIRAMVMAPVMQEGRVIVAPRTMLEGVIDETGTEHLAGARHFVHVRFTSLKSTNAQVAIDGVLTAVDNARESVDDGGRVLGPPLRSLVRSRADWASLLLGSIDPVAGALLFSAFRGEAEERHRRVVFVPGTDMTVRLRVAAPLPMWPDDNTPAALAPDQTQRDLFLALPARGLTAGGRGPGDFVNIVLLGTQAQVQRAFIAAGWDVPDRMSTRADFDTFIKAAAAEGYQHQPVSAQTMFGRDPDLAFQRVTDTFAKRHHVRLWQTNVQWAGTPVWVAAATHDIGVLVSKEHRGFTHRVEDAIDLERDKIVDDLWTMQQIDQLGYLDRTPAPPPAERGAFQSDWRVAIVKLRP
ncbi:LssY C-terminal domain-containing protein [Gemmatimonas aurantiaca]|uniref:LssY C-terminal domain-containing protein n=1 Tax=Gemmatimonas aurantiaca TaxID=173480 RepID=UPI00301B9AE4